MCFWTKKSKNLTTTKQTIKHKNPCRSREGEPGTSRTQSGCVTDMAFLRVVYPFIGSEILGE